MKRIDLTGRRFGKLIVQGMSYISGKGTTSHKIHWKCICDCGNICHPSSNHLLQARTISCGCFKSEFMRKDPPKIATAKVVYRSRYKDGDITFDQFLELSQKSCEYCGEPPSNKRNSSVSGRNRYDEYWFTYNGLDRVDNSKPHTLDNVVPCCYACNTAKLDRTKEEFLEWVRRVYVYNN